MMNKKIKKMVVALTLGMVVTVMGVGFTSINTTDCKAKSMTTRKIDPPIVIP